MYTTKKGGMIMKLSNMSKMSGFTLAEVLITLGIIGVVAAMTMPTLINSTQGAQYKAAYKKALSAISQGVTLNVALDGSSFADATDVAGIKDILAAHMNVVRGADAPDDVPYETTPTDLTQKATNYSLYFNDGIIFSFQGPSAAGKICSDPTRNPMGLADASKLEKCTGFIDVNGLKGPNKIVTCNDGEGNSDNCQVTNPTDIYPVVYFDQTVEPNSEAARAVLYGK